MPRYRAFTFLAAAFAVSLPCAGIAEARIEGLDSREYKVGISPAGLPQDPEAALEAVSRRLGPVLALRFQPPKRGTVQFSDTADCTLTRHSLLLRSRPRPGKAARNTLKIRNPDILIADTMPLSLAKPGEADLEDDRSIGPDGAAYSNFSRSLSFDAEPPRTLAELGRHIRNLEAVLQFPKDASLRAGPLANSAVFVSEPVSLAGETAVSIEVSFWHAASDGAPLAGDVSFTLEEPFDYPSVRAADALLARMAEALGPLRGASGEKALAVLPEPCR